MSPLATWAGPGDALLPDRGILRIGDQRDVTDRDLESAHWQAVNTTPAPAAAKPAATASKPAEEATD